MYNLNSVKARFSSLPSVTYYVFNCKNCVSVTQKCCVMRKMLQKLLLALKYYLDIVLTQFLALSIVFQLAFYISPGRERSPCPSCSHMPRCCSSFLRQMWDATSPWGYTSWWSNKPSKQLWLLCLQEEACLPFPECLPVSNSDAWAEPEDKEISEDSPRETSGRLIF